MICTKGFGIPRCAYAWRGSDKDVGMMEDVKGAIKLDDGMECVVCMPKDGGRTEGLVLGDKIIWEDSG